MDNDNVKSHKSTEETRKKTENNINCDQVRFEKIELDSKLFFEKKICSIDDVSSFTGYAIGTLYNLTSQNLIPHRKKRGRLFFVPTEILNWIDEGDL